MYVLRNFTSLPTGAVLAVMLLATTWSPQKAAAEHANFNSVVFPIIQEYCVSCHQPGGEGHVKSGLDLRTYEGIMKGTRHGPIVVPGDAFLSNLNVLIEGRAAPESKMPHFRKGLTRWERLMIRRWVNRGAKNN
jgi:uncharacterized membrane protein